MVAAEPTLDKVVDHIVHIAEPVGEMIHVSVLQRLGTSVWHEKNTMSYRPTNVLSVLDVIEESYAAAKLQKRSTGSGC